MRMGGQSQATVPLPPGRRRVVNCTGGWVGPMTDLDGCRESRLNRGSIPDRPARSESLYRLSYLGPPQMYFNP